MMMELLKGKYTITIGKWPSSINFANFYLLFVS